MESSNRIILIAGIVFIGLLHGAFGHSYVTSPISRSDQQQTETGCRGPACLGPCDVPLASKTRAAISTQRGSSLNIQWPRNNHAGGFIRFAWAPTAQSDSMATFDANVQQINCHEVGGCGPSDPSDPNGGDTNPADGSVNPCQTTIKVPSNLADGAWTLQWAWFGGAFSLGDYFSCVDYQVSGGSALVSTSPNPVYIGGDYTYPGQGKCKFFNTDKIHECIDEPCNNPIYPLSQEQSGPAAGFSSASSSSSSSSTSSSSSSSSSTTGKATSTSTTGKATSTTGRASSTTTSTTGRATSTSSSTSSSSSSGHNHGATSSTSTTGQPHGSTSSSSSSGQHGSTSSSSSSGQHGSTSSTSGQHGSTSTSTSGHSHGSTSTSSSSSSGHSHSSDGSSSSSSSGHSGSSSSSSGQPPSGSCNTGNMVCLTSETFSTCAHSAWGPSQSCALGTTCSPSGSFIYCI